LFHSNQGAVWLLKCKDGVMSAGDCVSQEQTLRLSFGQCVFVFRTSTNNVLTPLPLSSRRFNTFEQIWPLHASISVLKLGNCLYLNLLRQKMLLSGHWLQYSIILKLSTCYTFGSAPGSAHFCTSLYMAWWLLSMSQKGWPFKVSHQFSVFSVFEQHLCVASFCNMQLFISDWVDWRAAWYLYSTSVWSDASTFQVGAISKQASHVEAWRAVEL